MASNWHKAVFAWSFGMIWGFMQALVQVIYRHVFLDRFWYAKGKYLRYRETKYDQPEPELTKEQEESLDEQWPSGASGEPSDDEWVSAQRFYEEGEKCDKLYRKAEAEYLDVMRNTAPDDPIREKYRPKPYPSKEEIWYYVLHPGVALLAGLVLTYGAYMKKLLMGALTHHHVHCLLRDPENLVPQPQVKDIMKVLRENSTKSWCPMSVTNTALALALKAKRDS